jgi:hypothetical protein
VQCHLYQRLQEHPNILRIEFVHLSSYPMHRGFEVVELGTLSQYLSSRRPKFEQRLHTLKQV